jgi:hypothetical protein
MSILESTNHIRRSTGRVHERAVAAFVLGGLLAWLAGAWNWTRWPAAVVIRGTLLVGGGTRSHRATGITSRRR